MTTILKSITGTENILVNSIAAIGVTFVTCLVFTFITLSFIYGIKAF